MGRWKAILRILTFELSGVIQGKVGEKMERLERVYEHRAGYEKPCECCELHWSKKVNFWGKSFNAESTKRIEVENFIKWGPHFMSN